MRRTAAGLGARRTKPRPSRNFRSRVLLLGAALALVWSTQFLAQPFVWRNWPADEVMVAWLGILAERLLVAMAICAAALLVLALFARRPGLPNALRSALYVLAVVGATLAAELLLRAVNAPGAAATAFALGEHVLRWTTVTLAVSGLWLAWLRAADTDAAANRIRQAEIETAAQLAALRLQSLQAQIEPHFLFNTLATVRRLASTEPVASAKLLAHLVDFITLSRAALPDARRWRVADEIALVRAYLGVIAQRMNGRLQLAFELESAALEQEAPPLVMATLAENAVKHGVTPCSGSCEIRVVAQLRQGQLRLQVADTGVGLEAGQASGGSGIGLANTRARLGSLYGNAARLALAPNQPQGVVATLEWPASAAASA